MSKKSKKRQATSSPGPSEMADERAPGSKEPGPSTAKKEDPQDASEQSRTGESFAIVTPSAAASPASRFGLRAESADGADSAMEVDDFSVAQSGDPAPVIGSGPRARPTGSGVVPIEADDAKHLGLEIL
uniref:Uncharacterized protein n=1 Tax=Caenorhabditis japonica TaxID=281687 RepID=A0A8R1ING6_CAEJA